MEASNPQRMMEMDRVQFQYLDIISHLPANVINVILTCLPLRDAVRTSILSRAWRYKWIRIPHLIFDKQSTPPSVDDPEFNQLKLVNVVEQVLLRHRGPIQEFKCQYYLKSCSAIDRWILLLLDNGVERFTLHLSGNNCYKAPSCLFRFRNLTHLEMSWCIFKPPSKFEGLRSLRTLHLSNVTIDNSFEDMISKFPFLEALTLRVIYGPTHLKVRGPKLLYLDIGGKLKYLCLENIQLVATACIQISSQQDYKKSKESNLIKVLGCLYGVERLTIEGFLSQLLVAGDVPERLPMTYNHLKNLTLKINLEERNEFLVFLCLCRSSPNLHELCIRDSRYLLVGPNLIDGPDLAHDMDNDDYLPRMPHKYYWLLRERLDGLFPILRIATVTCILGSRYKLGFVVLEKMNIMIRPKGVLDEGRIFRDLLAFRRASPQARIFLGYCEAC